MSFAIVEFDLTEEVEVVPATWVEDDICLWPGGKVDRVHRLIKVAAAPRDDWERHAAHVKGLFSSYEAARRKLNRAQFTSDLASTDEEERRRVARPKRFLIDSDSDERSPPPRKKAARKVAGTHEVYPRVPQAFPAPCTSGGALHAGSSVTAVVPDVQSAVALAPGGPNVISSMQPQTPVTRDMIPEREFQRQVLRQLQVNRLMLEQVLDLLTTMQGAKGAEVSPTNSLIPKPFADLTDFKQFDANVDTLKEQLLHELQCLGGNNVQGATKRVLTYLIQDSVAQHYSWIGNKGKEKFKNLNVTPVIMSAVRSNKLFSATLDEVEGIIKKWLQHAPCRLKLQQDRSAKKAEAAQDHLEGAE